MKHPENKQERREHPEHEKKCDKTCCCNPRHNKNLKHKERVTIAELQAEEKFKCDCKEDM